MDHGTKAVWIIVLVVAGLLLVVVPMTSSETPGANGVFVAGMFLWIILVNQALKHREV